MDRKVVHSRQYAGSCTIRIGEEAVASKTILHSNVQELIDWAEDYLSKIDCVGSRKVRESASYHIAFGLSPEFRFAD